MIDPYHALIFGDRTLLVGLDLTTKATVPLLAAYVCHGALGRRRTLARSAIWNASLVGLLLLPASLALPRWIVTIPSPEATLTAPITHESRAILPEPIASTFAKVVIPDPVVPRLMEPTLAVSTTRPILGGMDIVIGFYLLIVAVLAARLAVALKGIAGLREGCARVHEDHWRAALDHWRGFLGISRRVLLLASDRVSVPIVVGWFRPSIIVPRSLIDSAGKVVIDAVVLHELGHVKRGDFAWNVTRKLVQIVYWPHPLAWRLGRVVGAVREQACDDLCVHALGGAVGYRATLIEVAAGLVRRPDSALGLAMARATNLSRRLAWIDRGRGVSRCLLSWPGRVGLVAVAVVGVGIMGSIKLAHATAQEPAKPASEPPAAIEITIRGKDTGKPLAGARVKFSIGMDDTHLAADRDGRARVDLTKQAFKDGVWLEAWADGYIQQRIRFDPNDPRNPTFPRQFTVNLWPGEQTLGGKVVDERGRPIAGVKIEIWGDLGERKEPVERVYGIEAVTDANGEWRSRSFRGMKGAWLYLSHPDHVSDNDSHPRVHGETGLPPDSIPISTPKPFQPLCDFTNVQVLAPGVDVAGEVRDQDGRPVAKAAVGWFSADDGGVQYRMLRLTTSDDRGRFRFQHVRAGRVALQVMAKGHAPTIKIIDAKTNADHVVIALEPGHTIKGQVVDHKGKPIEGAVVGVGGWRGYQTLNVSLKTDAEGRFRWDDAPPDSVDVGVQYEGYHLVAPNLSAGRISPDHEAHFILRPTVSVSGAVREAKSDKPIESVSIKLGVPDPRTGGFTWGPLPYSLMLSKEKFWGYVDSMSWPEFRLKFTAQGYKTVESRTFRADERQVRCDVAMTRTDVPEGVPVVGVVRRPDGLPLAGADVVISYPLSSDYKTSPSAGIRNGMLETNEFLPAARTDAEGRFKLWRKPDSEIPRFALVVVHPDFYAETSRPAFEADSTITARPWGRVRGVARIGRRPAAGVTVQYRGDRMSADPVLQISVRGETRTDAEGRFEFARVAPVDIRVKLALGDPLHPQGDSYGVLVELKPGATALVKLGGTGRPVIATIARPPGFDTDGEYVDGSTFDLESDRPRIPYPDAIQAKHDVFASFKWAADWWVSPAGRADRATYFRLNWARLQPDGTIRVDDVPPGKYRLTLRYSPDAMRGGLPSDRVARATVRFTIPEIPGGASDVPFDLGVLKPTVQSPQQAETPGH